MPNPKRRHSNTRTRIRRSHDALRLTAPNHCSRCGAPVRQHRVCENCGYYQGREVVAPKAEEK